MNSDPYPDRLEKCSRLMKKAGIGMLDLEDTLYGVLKEAVKANMVVSVGNCGLYLGDFGVRVEDTVVVGEKGHVVLTSTEQFQKPYKQTKRISSCDQYGR